MDKKFSKLVKDINIQNKANNKKLRKSKQKGY